MHRGMSLTFRVCAGLLTVLLQFLASVTLVEARQLPFLRVQNEERITWSLDLSHWSPQESLFLYFPDSQAVNEVEALMDKSFLQFFDYAMPRFEVRYDSFDCLERVLISKDGQTDPNRGGGGLLGIPGSPIEQEAPSRGQVSDLFWEWIPAQNGPPCWKDREGMVLRVRVLPHYEFDKRILKLGLRGEATPEFWIDSGKYTGYSPPVLWMSLGLNGSWMPEATHVTDNAGEMYFPASLSGRQPELRADLLDSWFFPEQGQGTPELIYSWDIGTEGGDKCNPCTGLPPDYGLVRLLGMDRDIPEHLYFTVVAVPASVSLRSEMHKFQKFQWNIIMQKPATGFLDCKAALAYKRSLAERKKREERNAAQCLGRKYLKYK